MQDYELKEFLILKEELFNGNQFVIPDYTDYKWKRYNALVKKYQQMLMAMV